MPGIKIKTINYGEKMLMTEVLLSKGAVLPEHQHPHEQTGYLVKGEMVLHIQGQPKKVKAGDSWNIGGKVSHSAEVLEDSVAIEVFHPVREDYLKYLRNADIME